MKPQRETTTFGKILVFSRHWSHLKVANKGEHEASRVDDPEGIKSVVDGAYSFEDDPVVGRFNRFGTEMSAMVSALTQVVSARSLTSYSLETQGAHSSSSSAGLKTGKLGIDSTNPSSTSSFDRVHSSFGPIGESIC